MRRRRGGGAAPAEACGVWLDTAELKRGPARPPGARAAPSRQSPAPRARQSTMARFLRAPPDGGDKENRGPAAPPTRALRILALPPLQGAREEPPGAQQGLRGTARAGQTLQEPLELQGESQRGAGGHCPGRGGGRNRAGESPGETAPGSRKAQPRGTAPAGTDPAGAGDTNPAPGAAPSGVCCSPQSPGPAQPLREHGQVLAGSCRQLFCQGSRVTAHRDRASPSPPRTSPSPPRTGPSPWQPPELGSELLFTQDSEGHRVIKHW